MGCSVEDGLPSASVGCDTTCDTVFPELCGRECVRVSGAWFAARNQAVTRLPYQLSPP